MENATVIGKLLQSASVGIKEFNVSNPFGFPYACIVAG
jgi:hypothetical protein